MECQRRIRMKVETITTVTLDDGTRLVRNGDNVDFKLSGELRGISFHASELVHALDILVPEKEYVAWFNTKEVKLDHKSKDLEITVLDDAEMDPRVVDNPEVAVEV